MAGCGSKIALGSECADFAGSCSAVAEKRDDEPKQGEIVVPRPHLDGGPPTHDAAVDAQAQTTDGAEPDARTLPGLAEAGTDAGRTGPNPVANPSFEGPVGSVSPIQSVQLPGWESCGGNVSVVQSATVSAGFPAMQTTLLPTEGATFLELSLVGTGPGAVLQTLAQPLVAGESYSFAMDIAQSGIGTASLEVRSGKNSCAFGAALAKTGALTADGTWHSACLTVSPEAEVTDLALVMTASVAGVSVYLDDLRRVAACP